MNGKRKSLISSIMGICVAVVVVTAAGIGGNSVVSLKSMATSAYDTYANAVNEGYKDGRTGPRGCERDHSRYALQGRPKRVFLDRWYRLYAGDASNPDGTGRQQPVRIRGSERSHDHAGDRESVPERG